MHIGQAWIVLTVCAGFALGALFGRFIQGAARRNATRSGRPELHQDGKDIIIANRLDEELRLVKIAANAGFALSFRQGMPAGSVLEVEHWFKRSRKCDKMIVPKGQSRLRMLLKESKKTPVVYLTFESSAGTLRNEIVSVAMISQAT